MADNISDEALRAALKQRRKYIEANLDNLTMKACRKLLEEDLGLPEKSLAQRKDFVKKYVDKIIAHKAKGDSGSTKQPSKSGPATKKRKAALEDEDEGEEPASKSKAEPRTSKTIEKVKRICKAATIKIPPSMYVKSKSLTEVEADMQALLAKHELSLDSSTHDISKAAARLAKERDLEGIDVSNIVQGGRRARRAAVAAPINYAAVGKATSSSDDDHDEAEEDSADDGSASEGSDAAGSADEGAAGVQTKKMISKKTWRLAHQLSKVVCTTHLEPASLIGVQKMVMMMMTRVT